MSVLCVQIPDLLLEVAYRDAPSLRARPLALLDGEGTLCAVNGLARQAGVVRTMQPQQALVCCPELSLVDADLAHSTATQMEMMATVAELALPTEEHGWGRAYLDLRSAAHATADVQQTAAALGQTLRHRLGQTLVPALGWDSSKFTARAAATHTPPGKMKLIAKPDEARFLSPLSTRLLPLALATVQELSWLGVQTLGHFGRLPQQAVVQRYGAAGKVAHRWARGKDNRPVRPTVFVPEEGLTCTFDPPIATLEPVIATFQAALQPQLIALQHQLNGIRRMQLALSFWNNERRAVTLLFVEPVGDLARIIQHLRAKLEALNWPDALVSLEVKLLEVGELIHAQSTLFEAEPSPAIPLSELSQRFTPRYGPIFHQAHLHDAAHALPERRFQLQPA